MASLYRAVQERVLRGPQPLLRLVSQFEDFGVGRTFRYKNHPPGTTVTITRAHIKRPGVGKLWGVFETAGGDRGPWDGRGARKRASTRAGEDAELTSVRKAKWFAVDFAKPAGAGMDGSAEPPAAGASRQAVTRKPAKL